MSIESAIAAELKGDAGVLAIVGTKVHIGRAHPQSTVPYIVIRMRTSTGHEKHTEGVSLLTRLRGDLVCHAATVSAVVSLANVVRIAMDGFQGTMGSGGNTADVRLMSLSSPVDDLYAPTDGGAEGIHTRTIDFMVWLNEAIA